MQTEKLTHLVQIFLPLKDNAKNSFPPSVFAQVQQELVHRFGGMTAFLQNPAKGLWAENNHKILKDEIVVLEVMAGTFDRTWWTAYRKKLETRFAQDAIVIRASPTELL